MVVGDVMQMLHMALLLPGIIKEWITTLGPEKVGSLCTGDASSLRAARPLVASSEGFTHILQGW